MNVLRVYGRYLPLDLLAILFGISSWISINGLWVELPLLVERLPEGWNLASYLSIIVQLANLGPLLYTFIRWLAKGKSWDKVCIYLLLTLGTTAGILLALYWDRTLTVAGSNHSVALFALVFFLSLVDCTSSILFLPFMAVFRDIYLNSYLVGEGLSGFIPSIAALTQGVGGNPYCKNVSVFNATTNETEYEMQLVNPEPRFPIDTFFEFLAGMMAVSTIAFFLLNVLPQIKEEHASRHQIVATAEVPVEISRPPSPEDPAADPTEEKYPPWLSRQQQNMALTRDQTTQAKWDFYTLLAIQGTVCFLSNGALPSIQTFSCLPYGNLVYHLSVTLNSMANPIMAFTAFFVSVKKVVHIKILTVVGMIFVVYILATSFFSPGMLLGQNLGGSLTVRVLIVIVIVLIVKIFPITCCFRFCPGSYTEGSSLM